MHLLHAHEGAAHPGPTLALHRVPVRDAAIAVVLFLVLPLAVAVAGGYALLPHLRALPLWLLAPALALGLLPLGLFLLVGGTLLGALVDALRPTSWVLRATPDGLLLNLRSYRNAHFPASHPTVLYVPLGEVESVRPWTLRVEPASAEGMPRVRRALEIRVRTDTAQVAQALRAERELPPQPATFLGLRFATRENHEPVRVPAPGVLRVEGNGRRLARGLPPSVRVLEPVTERAGGAEDRRAVEERILELASEGETIAAVELVRTSYGLGLAEAKRFVDELRGAA